MGGLSSRHAVLDLVAYTERLWASFAPTLRAVVVKSMGGLHLASKYRYVRFSTSVLNVLALFVELTYTNQISAVEETILETPK